MINIKQRFTFTVSPWFETLFALQVLTDDQSRIHQKWKSGVRMPTTFDRQFAQIGGSPFLWPVIADTLLAPSELSFPEKLSRFTEIPPRDLQKKIFLGILHEAGPVDRLLNGWQDFFQTITQVSKIKREWLAYLGLYPPNKEAPLFRGLQMLLRSPVEFRRIVANLMEIFWTQNFGQIWNQISDDLERSREEKERLFYSCSLDEFARLVRLRIEVDERKGVITAVRGGYSLSFKRLAKAIVMPSAFNDQRHWTVDDSDPYAVVAYFPYFDPVISLTTSDFSNEEPELDPALLFKALGDTTRFGLVSLLSKGPSTSATLAKKLDLTRATVSHHIHLLREAGLIDESAQGNTILLTLRRATLENLSRLTIAKLYGPADVQIKKKKAI